MIESLHSPHIARVKALISSRGNKERGEHGQFIAEGLQCAREALAAISGPKIKTLFLTESGQSRIDTAGLDTSSIETILVSEPVMAAMSSTITPQGILSVCEIGRNEFSDLKLSGSSRFIFLHEIQDPGNAGTILRSADAMGIDAVITSPWKRRYVFAKGGPSNCWFALAYSALFGNHSFNTLREIPNNYQVGAIRAGKDFAFRT